MLEKKMNKEKMIGCNTIIFGRGIYIYRVPLHNLNINGSVPDYFVEFFVNLLIFVMSNCQYERIINVAYVIDLLNLFIRHVYSKQVEPATLVPLANKCKKVFVVFSMLFLSLYYSAIFMFYNI